MEVTNSNETNFSKFENQQKLPNSTAVIILGVISIIGCCCYGILGIICGVIALILAKKDTELYKQNPGLYKDYKNISTGRILAIIGIVLSVIYLIYTIWIFTVIGFDGMQDPAAIQQKINEMFRK